MALPLVAPRLIAALLCLLWAALAAVIAVGYRVGGPADLLVGLSLLVPSLASAAAVVRPFGPLDRPWHVAVAWLGIASVLLVAPLLVDLLSGLSAGVPLPVAPSPDTAYAGALALLGTCLFSCAGLAGSRDAVRSPRRGVAAAAGTGVVLALLGGASFGAGVLATQEWLDERPVAPSAWGPTDPASVPSTCSVPPALGPSARLLVTGSAAIDSHVVATARIEGARSGRDEAWAGRLESRFGDGTLAYSRVGQDALLSIDGAGPQPIEPGLRLADPQGLTLDGPLLTIARDPRTPTVAEDLGVELFDGAPARHCRVAVDGDTVLGAVLVMRWLAGEDPRMPSTALNIWRGELDWWTFGDGALGRAVIRIGGYPGDAWDATGIAAVLEAELRALDRGASHRVLLLDSGT
jgi:hypothetical protein